MRIRSRATTVLLSLALAASVAPATSAAGERDLTWESHVLGTLGGPSGQAAAIDGDLVAGRAHVPRPADDEGRWPFHAVVADLTTRGPLVDLGTLGGESSAAYDIDGDLVVGKAHTPEGLNHAFYVDLSAETPEMVDMGTLGGRSSTAFEVEGRTIVGISKDAEGRRRPFVYDVDAARPRMRELPLGPRWRRASVVDLEGGVVVGDVRRPGGVRHAYAIDLNGRRPVFRDLGTLGGRTFVLDLGGGLVVGKSIPKGERYPRAFQVDLRTAEPRMRMVGAGWGEYGEAQVTDGKYVLGVRAARPKERLFVYEAAAPKRTFRDLGPTREWAFYRVTSLHKGRYVGVYRPKQGARLMYGDLRWRNPAPVNVASIGGDGLPEAVIHRRRVVAPTRVPGQIDKRSLYPLTLWRPVR